MDTKGHDSFNIGTDYLMLVGKAWVGPESRETMQVIIPSSGKPIADVPIATDEDTGAVGSCLLATVRRACARGSKLGRILALAAAGVLASCVTTPAATIEQPELTVLAQPYAARLLALGVSRIETPGVGGTQWVKVETPYGYFDIRYREGLAPAPFVLIPRDNTAFVRSDTYVPAQLPQYREAINWVVPEVLRVAPRNETEMRAWQAGSGR